MKKEVIEAWLRSNWPPDLGRCTDAKVSSMATLLRHPDFEAGGNRSTGGRNRWREVNLQRVDGSGRTLCTFLYRSLLITLRQSHFRSGEQEMIGSMKSASAQPSPREAKRVTLGHLPSDVTRRRILDTAEAAAFCRISVPHWRRLYRAGKVPKPLRLSTRKYGWRLGDLLDFIDERAGKA